MCENAHRRLEDTVPLMTDIYAKHEEVCAAIFICI